MGRTTSAKRSRIWYSGKMCNLYTGKLGGELFKTVTQKVEEKNLHHN